MGECVPVTISDSGSPDFWAQFMQAEEDDTTIAGIISDIDMTFDPTSPTQNISPGTQGTHTGQSSQRYSNIKFFDNLESNSQPEEQRQQQRQQLRSCNANQAPPPAETGMQNNDSDSSPQEQGHLDQSILHLSQLSARLSSLLSSSREYPLINGDESAFCSDDNTALQQLQSNISALFDSINVWLARGSAHLHTVPVDQNDTCPSSQPQLMSQILSASFEMTRIIQRLRIITTPETTPPPSTRDTPPETLSESSRHTYSTVRYLVVVCVTLLLNTYIGIVVSLQHSAEALKAYQWACAQTQPRRSTNSVCTWNTTDCIKLQFVGMVQMCSSFMRRQIEVSELLMPSHISSSELSGGNSCWDAVGKLKLELEQRLKQLQKCLGMVD
ncbi:hypothetical protein PtrSN002B_001260 [Pyrenophora tritici-repentis]|uniref:Uncharacterized protein n=2 Tax=Pyrenophora tritici-repentis TaxID=45151 RepID=A0A2W1GIN8_9PLEO|nr:uncharacterized protein PTRG_04247 [Pyrenophora tritici-repentis Pt-1C-BFP]KAA8619665.1 hypothetical protein PtrV1_06759 [Pyrenophora tritici-repentis]EDU47085.1 predicted protein [Pyrenophora tritici-repentis Pt-1C-BFP]KAF7447805.1 hypothetical protein A1F99_071690 [Pyrenophora tritici-repentis]KAF7571507.1 hypothetical protein PtrM4_090070 [Pyrenophora tritici-repentis]KAG9385268.1 hypothetical protein A1F94_004815 [Pyrenophora tritici-repentis]